jgi:sulfate adenylyltransferase
MAILELTKDQYTNFEKICLGAYHPLDGFMNEEDFHSVVDNLRLANGKFFPLPVICDVSEKEGQAIIEVIEKTGGVALHYKGEEVGELKPTGLYKVDKLSAAKKIYGFATREHPGVAAFLDLKPVFVAGSVTLKKRVLFDYSADELTPSESKRLFREKGWKTVACFATRNIPHRGHEYLQRIGLEMADGLFIHVTTPPPQTGNYRPEAIKRAYRIMIDKFYGSHRAILSFVSTPFRGAGPREALFQAVMKRNYGCSHFIIGRDHSGVKGFYGKYAAHELSLKYEDRLGIGILRLHGPYYCLKCKLVVTEQTCRHSGDPASVVELKSTPIRDDHANNLKIENTLMRPEVLECLEGMDILYRSG